MSHSKFTLGRVVITTNAQSKLDIEDAANALINRHVQGDWGDLDDEDKHQNDAALLRESQGRPDARLHSVYTDRNGTKFWIITEWDRSVTAIMLPEDY